MIAPDKRQLLFRKNKSNNVGSLLHEYLTELMYKFGAWKIWNKHYQPVICKLVNYTIAIQQILEPTIFSYYKCHSFFRGMIVEKQNFYNNL